MTGNSPRLHAALGQGVIPAFVMVVVLAGAILRVATQGRWSQVTWMAGLVLVGLPLAWRTVRGMARGHFATDVVATLAILAAIILGMI